MRQVIHGKPFPHNSPTANTQVLPTTRWSVKDLWKFNCSSLPGCSAEVLGCPWPCFLESGGGDCSGRRGWRGECTCEGLEEVAERGGEVSPLKQGGGDGGARRRQGSGNGNAMDQLTHVGAVVGER